MFDQLVGRPALGAEVVPAVRVALVGRDLGDLVVLHRHVDSARRQAVPAEGVHRLRDRVSTHPVILPEPHFTDPPIGIEHTAHFPAIRAPAPAVSAVW
jgi:hypothetical protein